jgi:hypothetical protein
MLIVKIITKQITVKYAIPRLLAIPRSFRTLKQQLVKPVTANANADSPAFQHSQHSKAGIRNGKISMSMLRQEPQNDMYGKRWMPLRWMLSGALVEHEA